MARQLHLPHHDINTRVKHSRGGFGDGLCDEWCYGGGTFFTDMSSKGACVGDTILHLLARGTHTTCPPILRLNAHGCRECHGAV